MKRKVRAQAKVNASAKVHCAVLKARKRKHSGSDGVRDPPVPIPNTEVKPHFAEGNWLDTDGEIRTPPDSNNGQEQSCPFFHTQI